MSDAVVPLPAEVRRALVGTLTPLLELVESARRLERDQHSRRGITPLQRAELRRTTLNALEDYAAVLEKLTWPVPRQMLQEMRLYRALLRTRTAPVADRSPVGSGTGSRTGSSV